MTNVEPPGAEPEENRLIAERRVKLAALRAQGPAFPNDFRRDALAADLLSTYQERDAAWLEANPVRVRVGGRMMFKRLMGKASFAKLADRSGAIQLFLQEEALGAAYEAFKGYDVGDIVGAVGPLFRTRTGELTVRVAGLKLLVRQRYVDLVMNESSRAVFRSRSAIVRYLRDALEALDFLEVETPMMQPIPGGAAARPFVTHHNALDQTMYLRIAPELYLKRLIVGGLERVFEINRNFRNEGLSTQHNPEFTMLELYWAYSDYQELMELIERLLRGLCDALLGTRVVRYQGRDYDLSQPFRRATVEELICEHNPELERSRLREVPYLRAACDRLGLGHKPADGAGKLQIEIFGRTAEHALLDPTFVCAYPTEVSPLSRANDADPFLTDRFEFYIAGRELANGFSELNDSEDQAARFRAQVARLEAGDDEAMHYDADYIRALEYGMPPTAGLGIGVDRLVMFLTDSASIRDVLLFPQLRPES